MTRVVRPLSRAAFIALTRGLSRVRLTPEQRERMLAFEKRLRKGVDVVDRETGETAHLVLVPREDDE